jgi:hypothetical protein
MLLSVDEVFFWQVRLAVKGTCGQVRYQKKTSTGRKDYVADEGYF